MKIKLKKPAVRITSAILAAVLCAGLWLAKPEFTPSVHAAESANIQNKREEIAALEQKQNELLGKINALSDEQKQTEQYKTDLDSLVSTVEKKISTANELIKELEKKIAETETAITEKEEQIAETTEKFKERMRANHEAGVENYFSIIIGAEDIGDFLSRVDRVNTMLEYDKNLQKKYSEEKKALEEEKKDLVSSKSLQEKTLKDLEADKAESERLANQAQSYINSLQADKSAYQAEYNKAKAAEAALDAEIEAILRDRQNQNSQQQTASGEYMWPLPTGKGYISCHFGDSDPIGRPHYAVDVAGIGHGCPIYAANDGYVVTATYHYSYGNYVLIDHGNGRATLYAHCSGLAVSAGSNVTKGQTIGYAGTTGFSTGVHLHFEFRINGQKVNALNYITPGC